ncbi:hypothetical protein [Dactylosporangium sp. NPDC000521]
MSLGVLANWAWMLGSGRRQQQLILTPRPTGRTAPPASRTA